MALPPVTGLRDAQLARRLERDGYARLGPFLDEREVEAAAAVYDEAMRRLGRPIGDQWFPTILLPEDDVRTFITEELTAIIGPHLDALFEPEALDVVRLDLSVKPPTATSELGPHQDFTLVDERVAQSLYLWIPLVDTGERNGTLHVVPGSHRFANRIRSRHVPAVFDDVLDLVHASSIRLDCRAGELVIMVSGVIHHSPPNRSDRVRVAAHGIVKPSAVPLVFYFVDDLTPEGLVECYELDIDQYVRAIHQGRPPGRQPDRFEERPVSGMDRQRYERGCVTDGW